MSTAFLDISAALDGALNTFASGASVAVAWENSNFEPTTGTKYLRPTLLPADTTQAESGSSGKDFTTGIYQVDVICPINTGKGEAVNLADDIADTFSRGSIHTYNGVNVRIRRASRRAGNRDGAWFIVPVDIEFFVYTAAR